MGRWQSALLVLVILLAAQSTTAGKKAESRFEELAGQALRNLQEFWPVYATSMGVHDYDDRFTDYSPESVNNERRTLRDFLAKLYKLQSADLPPDMEIDFRLIKANCEMAHLRLSEIKYHINNPNVYLRDAADGLYLILAYNYAPLEKRLEDILGRMRALEKFLEQGIKNLENPPAIWKEYARQNTASVKKLYLETATYLKTEFPRRAGDIESASRTAAGALDRFAAFLDTLVVGDPKGIAIGKEYYDYILQHEYLFSFDSDSLLKIGEKLLAETQAARDELERTIGVKSGDDSVFVPASLCRQDVLDYYTWELDQVKRFVGGHDLLTIPPDIGTCKVMETPEFLRGIIKGIAYQPAGPFDTARTGYFYIRPIPDSLTAEQRRQYLLQIQQRGFRGSAVHEAYPGHHLQMQLACRAYSDVRRWQTNNLLVEGWALYCEEMAYDAGLYGDDRARYLGVLRGVIFRAARIIVDVKLQTGQFDYDQAVDWMCKTLGSDTTYIKSEVLRYSMDPGQPMTYLMGKSEIVRLRDKLKAREGAGFTLKSFHDRLLKEGSIPISLIEEKLYK